jgi:hypothetical protein
MPRRNRRQPDWVRVTREGLVWLVTRWPADLHPLLAPTWDAGPHEDGRSGSCVTGKIRYVGERTARLALASAVISRNLGRPGRAERRIYECLGASGCGGYHLTSRPSLAPTDRSTR